MILVIVFAIFLIPTKYTVLSEKLHLPSFLNPVFWLFAIIFTAIIINILKRQKVPKIPKRLLLPYIGLEGLMLLSLTYTPNLIYGVEKYLEFITYTTLACFAPFFLFRSIFVLERFFYTLIAMGIFLAMAVFITNPLYFFSPIKFHTVFGTNYLAIQQIVGTGALVILYYFLFKNRSRKLVSRLILLLIMLIGALFYAGGKGSVFSFFITIIFMLIAFIKFKDRFKKILINKRMLIFFFLLIFAGGLLSFSKIGRTFLIRTKFLLSSGSYAQVERLENAKVALELAYRHPLSGVGVGGFSDFSIQMKGIERFKYPHNIILEIISELGLIGFIFFVLIIAFVFKQFLYLQSKYRHSELYPLPNVILSLFIFSFLNSLASGNINSYLLFAWIGSAYAIKQVLKSNYAT